MQNISLNGLTDKTDKQLLKLIKKDSCSDAFNEILTRYEKLFYRVCHRYIPVLEKLGICQSEIFDAKNEVIFGCVSNFDIKRKTKLSSYIGTYTRFYCLNKINSRQHILNLDNEEITELIESNQVKTNFFHPSYKSEDINYIFYILDNLGDKRIKEVVKLRYYSDKEDRKWKNISKKMKISTQSCINLNNRGLSFIRQKMKEINKV